MPLRMSRKAQQKLRHACARTLQQNRQRDDQAATRPAVETLEKRTFLTAVVNGLFTGTNSIYEGGAFYEYMQGDGTTIRISVQGNITAEFIGARVPEGSGTVIIRDLVPAIIIDPETGEQELNSDDDGVNLFSIYVVSSDENSIISIAELNEDAPDGEERFMAPFAGSAGAIRFFNENSNMSETVSLANGAAYIGARTDFDAPFDDLPITTVNRRQFGLRPASAGQMFAGLEVAPGNDLGMFMLGGTVTGLVDISGSCQLFYAGNILTGDAGDIGELEPTNLRRNFYVGGDLENLVTAQSFGTITLDDASPNLDDIDYKTGFDLEVRGRLGQVFALDSFLGNVRVVNDKRVTGSGLAQRELEFRGPELAGFASYFDPVFGIGEVGLGDQIPNPSFFNDSFDSAQYLGALFSSELNSTEVIQVRGFTFGDADVEDHIDFYAVPLLGGQNVQVQLLETSYRLGVFDPDGRLIATDYNGTEFVNSRLNRPFRFTTDRPGSYRFAIARDGDINFNGIGDPGEDIFTTTSRLDYELRITRVADIAFGGLIANAHIATTDSFSPSITVDRGDLGQVRAGVLDSRVFSTSAPWTVLAGNLRAIEGHSIGLLETDVLSVGTGVDFLVPRGCVGLLRTFGTDLADSILMVNDDYSMPDGSFTQITALDDITLIDPALAVGVDIQVVDSASNLTGNLLSNRAIGVIRAVDVASDRNGPPVWSVNVDNIGDDGVIDLIEVSNSLGRLGQGGPAIATGPNGNVRYMRVPALVDRDVPGGVLDVQDLAVFVDPFFGGGSPQETISLPGETLRLTDDNGTEVAITPTPNTNAIDPDTGLPLPTLDAPGFLRVLSYPIRDKAGVAILNVTVYPITEVGTGAGSPGRGVRIASGTRGAGGGVEIGEIEVRSPGTDLTFSPTLRTFTAEATTPGQGQNADVLLSGDAPIDVWSIEARVPGGAETSGLTRVNNSTSGEIVNIFASHIGSISAQTVGLARQSTGAAVLGIGANSFGAANLPVNTYPFNQQRNFVVVTNATGGSGEPHHINSISSRGGVGNIIANGGSIGGVSANSDGRNAKGHEGINAPIYAIQNAVADPVRGSIVNVNIGEGVLPSGTGDVAFAGIYADGIIDRVRGSRADVRGDIVASGASAPVVETVNGVIRTSPTFIIGDVLLTNGSIIDADVATFASLLDARENIDVVVIVDRDDPLNAPDFDIRSIELSGNGGIIGSQVSAADVGLIVIDGGFGMIGSFVSSLGDSVIDGIVTDGYGVRSSFIRGGANINQIIARGEGKRVDTRSYSAAVRQSESRSFDAFSGLVLDGGNDLHKYLGTTAQSPKRKGLSDTGVIEDTTIVGSRQLGLLDAHRIIGREVFTTDANGRRRRIPFGSLLYPMRISFGNNVQTIRTRDVVDGLALTGGGLTSFLPGNDVQNTAINVTGRINTIDASGSIRGTTSIKALGSQGQIDTVKTKRSLFATVEARLDIGRILVGTYLGSPLIRAGRDIKTLDVHNSILSGANVIAGQDLENLIIGENLEAGATIRADSIGNQQIGGQVLGDIIIT